MNQDNLTQTQSRAVALSQPHADLPSAAEWEILQRMAKAFAESGLYPQIKNVAQAIATVQTGRELGVPAGAALRTIRVINGMPTEAAELMAALVYRDQGSDALRIVESTNERCVVRYKRREWKDEEAGVIVFTMDDAERADLLVRRPDQKGKSNWEKYPRAMLRSRAISEACRTAFQDSILGLYTAEEIAPERVTVTPEGEVVLEGTSAGAGELDPVVDVQTGEVLIPARAEVTGEQSGREDAASEAEGLPQAISAVGGTRGVVSPVAQPTTKPAGNGAHSQPQVSRSAAGWTREQLGAAIREATGLDLRTGPQWAEVACTCGLPVPASVGDMTQSWLLGLYQAIRARSWQERLASAASDEEVRAVLGQALADRDRRAVTAEQYTRLYDAAEARHAELSAPLYAQAG